MDDIAEEHKLRPHWLGKERIREFAQCAGHSFIWAQMACAFVEQAKDVEYNLDLMFVDHSNGSEYVSLDALYCIALENSFSHRYNHNDKIFRDIVGTIVVV